MLFYSSSIHPFSWLASSWQQCLRSAGVYSDKHTVNLANLADPFIFHPVPPSCLNICLQPTFSADHLIESLIQVHFKDCLERFSKVSKP